MTDKENLEAEILGRIIKKAEANGYKSEIENPVSADQQAKLIIQHAHLYPFLYKHPYKFAKAFWGMEKTDWGNIDKKDNWWEWQDCEYWTGNEAEFIGERWQYHLQTMVLCENPIDYLEKFL